MINVQEKVELVNEIYFARSAICLSGHNLTLRREFVNCSNRYNFLIGRVVNGWNDMRWR